MGELLKCQSQGELEPGAVRAGRLKAAFSAFVAEQAGRAQWQRLRRAEYRSPS